MAHHTRYDGTLGMLCLGGLLAVFLSGLLATQVFVYYRLYQSDKLRLKVTVGIIWLLDLAHSALICEANWYYLIANFADIDTTQRIASALSVTITLTAVTTFLVHCFFARRIYTLTKRKWSLAAPILLLAVVRVASAVACTVRMLQLGTWTGFKDDSAWLFTTALSVSAALDILIASCLVTNWRKHRSSWKIMDQIISLILLYTVETGVLTSVIAVASLICWATTDNNLVFIALQFAISKLYSSMFLVTLNSRKSFQERSQASSNQQGHPLSVIFPGTRGRANTQPAGIDTLMEINVEKTIHQVTDDGEISPTRFEIAPIRTQDSIGKAV